MRRGFSLIELIVSIAVMAILTGLMLSAIQKVRSAAARLQCANNLKQIALAATMLHEVEHHFPPAMRTLPGETYPHLGWLGRLLPFVEQENAWREAQNDYARSRNPFNATHPHQNMSRVLTLYGCPSDGRSATSWKLANYPFYPALALTSYLGNAGTKFNASDGVIYVNSRVNLLNITDGASNTILIFERPPSPDLEFAWWYAAAGADGRGALDFSLTTRHSGWRPGYPAYRDCPSGPYHFEARKITDLCGVMHTWSLHPGGANMAFCDGSVRFLSYSADPILPALSTRAGGEVISD